MADNGRARHVLELFVVVLVFAAALTVSLIAAAQQRSALCEFQKRSFVTQRQQILDDAQPQKPSEATLRAFPQLRPFYDTSNPLYAEQVRALNTRRDRRLVILGGRPDC